MINNIKQCNKTGEITENYKRFNCKKVITCIFTLDQDNPYYIDWNDSITNNCDIIKHSIKVTVSYKEVYCNIKKKLRLILKYKQISYYLQFSMILSSDISPAETT